MNQTVPLAGAPALKERLHILCERDVGLFSLIQQVIAQIPWALAEKRIPVVYFRDRCAYWTPGGYRGKSDSVWEYYFEPLFDAYPAAIIPEAIRTLIHKQFPPWDEHGRYVTDGMWLSHYFGGPLFPATLDIPFELQDPDRALRVRASPLIREFIRPRRHIADAVEDFFDRRLKGHYLIGVQIRGTDAASRREIRAFRQGLLSLSRYVEEVERALESHPEAKIFVATDAQSSLDHMIEAFGDRVAAYDSIRHQEGEAAGEGPTGALLPAYISGDPQVAAANGEQAIIEWLLLARCDELIHNGGSLARTALLLNPVMPHRNTHTAPGGLGAPGPRRALAGLLSRALERPRKALRIDFPRIRDRIRYLAVTRLNPLRKRKIERIIATKKRRERDGLDYNADPKISLLVHSFNQVENLPLLESRLRGTCADELIVCDDGSLDGSADEWARRLTKPNDFLIRSNDLHEIRILDRAIHMAKGEIVCIIQDDDRPPADADWIKTALALFDAHPRLAVLGGWLGFSGFFETVWNCPMDKGGAGPIRDVDPATGTPFMFVDHVNIGPYFIRRSAYLELGDFDRRYSPMGVSGVLFETEFCYRAWLAGFEVGLVDIPSAKWNNIGGTHLWGREGRDKQYDANLQRLRETYGDQAKAVTGLSEKANLRLTAVV